MIFKKKRGREGRKKWDWAEYKYLGFYLQKNNKHGIHIKESTKKNSNFLRKVLVDE